MTTTSTFKFSTSLVGPQFHRICKTRSAESCIRQLRCAASSDNDSKVSLDAAAKSYAQGIAAGAEEDDMVAQELGLEDASQMTDVQKKYKDAIKDKLEQRAEELRKEREARAVKFKQGQVAFSRGQYTASVALFESALNEEGPFSQLGGEIQLWLAEAYQACGREEDGINTYKTLENTHPIPMIKRKAASLRYIMEAPKLEIGEDEKVQIPVLTDLEANKGSRVVAPRPRPQPTKKREQSWDEKFWENYQPPKYLSNKYVWAAAVIVACGLAWYSVQAPH